MTYAQMKILNEEKHSVNLYDTLHPCLSTPTMFTNQYCSCLLGTTGGNDFRYIEDPSSIPPLKAHTNSPSLSTLS